jgi:hypothetical protein
MTALAPRTVQNMPERLRREPITVLQPASMTPEPTVANSVSSSGLSHRRSALAMYESHVWTAALMHAVSTSEKSKSCAGIDSAGFHTVRSDPFTISRFRSMAFSWLASRASLSCTAQISLNNSCSFKSRGYISCNANCSTSSTSCNSRERQWLISTFRDSRVKSPPDMEFG